MSKRKHSESDFRDSSSSVSGDPQNDLFFASLPSYILPAVADEQIKLATLIFHTNPT